MERYEEAGKYHDVLICPGCKALYIDSDGCPNYCIECENCNKITVIQNLYSTLLLELDLEICITCAAVWMEESKTKLPPKSVVEHVQVSDMGDHKGRK